MIPEIKPKFFSFLSFGNEIVSRAIGANNAASADCFKNFLRDSI
jgi:hypothetical protein